jgi:predicted AAA+ superfamily ATPase
MDLKSIIKEQRQELEKISKEEKIIKREKLEKAKLFLKHPNILVITGIRRCGKSIFSYLLEKDSKFGYINFDDERLIGLKAEELNNVLEAFYGLYGEVEYIILDEIQNILGWELFANRLRRTKKVIITGSNSNLLSGELSTHLTGRYIDIRLFPFSFKEFLDFKGFSIESAYTTEQKAKIINYLGEYLEKGGLPEVYKFGKIIISKIYEDILIKDIILRYSIKKIDELKKIGKYLISNTTQNITYSKLAKIFGIKNITTISNWVSYLEDSFLVFKLEKFDYKLKQQFIAPKKVFCIDTGIVDSIGFRYSENKGKIIENAVAIELQRKTPNLEVYYWQDYQQNEVDFVLKEGKKLSQLMQVSYINSKEEIREREINSLIKASFELKCNNLIVITWDYESEQTYKSKKIRFIPLWKWLLQSPQVL